MTPTLQIDSDTLAATIINKLQYCYEEDLLVAYEYFIEQLPDNVTFTDDEMMEMCEKLIWLIEDDIMYGELTKAMDAMKLLCLKKYVSCEYYIYNIILITKIFLT